MSSGLNPFARVIEITVGGDTCYGVVVSFQKLITQRFESINESGAIRGLCPVFSLNQLEPVIYDAVNTSGLNVTFDRLLEIEERLYACQSSPYEGQQLDGDGDRGCFISQGCLDQAGTDKDVKDYDRDPDDLQFSFFALLRNKMRAPGNL